MDEPTVAALSPFIASALRNLGYRIESEINVFDSPREGPPIMQWMVRAPGKTISIGGRFKTEELAVAQAFVHAKEHPEQNLSRMIKACLLMDPTCSTSMCFRIDPNTPSNEPHDACLKEWLERCCGVKT